MKNLNEIPTDPASPESSNPSPNQDDNLKMVCNAGELIHEYSDYFIFHCHYIESKMKLRLVELICKSEEVFLTVFNKRKLGAPMIWTLTEDDKKYNRKPFEWKREKLPGGGAWVTCYVDVKGARESFRCNENGVIETKWKYATEKSAATKYQTKSLYEKYIDFVPQNFSRAVFVGLTLVIHFIVVLMMDIIVRSGLANFLSETLASTAFGFFLGKKITQNVRRTWVELAWFPLLNIAVTFVRLLVDSAVRTGLINESVGFLYPVTFAFVVSTLVFWQQKR